MGGSEERMGIPYKDTFHLNNQKLAVGGGGGVKDHGRERQDHQPRNVWEHSSRLGRVPSSPLYTPFQPPSCM